MWVPVPQDWNKACQLIPGLPAQEPCSNPLPRAALCSQSTVCPFGCPRSLGGIETSWRHCPRQYCQAKLETKEAQLQVERGRCGQEGWGDSCPLHAPPSSIGISPVGTGGHQLQRLGLRGCLSAGNSTLWPREDEQRPLATDTTLSFSLLQAKSSHPNLGKLFLTFYALSGMSHKCRGYSTDCQSEHCISSCLMRLPDHCTCRRKHLSVLESQAGIQTFSTEPLAILGLKHQKLTNGKWKSTMNEENRRGYVSYFAELVHSILLRRNPRSAPSS